MKLGDVVVIDAAGEYSMYAADITRTLPVSGSFTAAQRAIYQLVRDAQAAAERNGKPGRSAQAAQDSSVVVRARGLAALGLIESEEATFDPPWQANCDRTPAACKQANFWMIHGISHGLGLAVHDPTQLNRQGNDSGTQYRSIILYANEAEKAAAEKSKAEAQKHFEKCLELQPNAAGPMNGLARCYKAQGKTDKAIEVWKKMTELYPSANAGTAGLAFTYLEQKKYKEALPYFEELAKAQPADQEVQKGLEKARKGAD